MKVGQTAIALGVTGVLVLGAGVLLNHRHQVMATTKLERTEAAGGKELFLDLCETCHGPGGNGAGGAPTLNDGVVLQTYPTPASLEQFIQTHMPASDPGILTKQETTDLTFYILQLNHRFLSDPG